MKLWKDCVQGTILTTTHLSTEVIYSFDEWQNLGDLSPLITNKALMFPKGTEILYLGQHDAMHMTLFLLLSDLTDMDAIPVGHQWVLLKYSNEPIENYRVKDYEDQ